MSNNKNNWTMVNNNTFQSEIIQKHPRHAARVMKVSTPHGEMLTPAFMPVGTHAYVNLMTPRALLEAGTQIILGGNTYHMLCIPGMETILRNRGMHKFMAWNHPMLTDSGGYQVFSLSRNKTLCRIDQDGAHFKHPHTGQLLHLTPKTSIEAQKIIGADIIMAFDECTPENGGREAAQAALTRTHRWLEISRTIHEKDPLSTYGLQQAFFGIIQGGRFQDLRHESARFVIDMDPDGFGIGGETIGYDMPKTCEVVDWIRPLLPEHKLRYTMGVGLNPQDLIDVVTAGVDIFDCVAPTRNARHGALYHGKTVDEGDWVRFDNQGEASGRILIKKSQYAHDESPILAGCPCTTCQQHTRAYLHYLFKNSSPAYHLLACTHNIQVMHDVCSHMRNKIMQGHSF